jgi:hypothetical protein
MVDKISENQKIQAYNAAISKQTDVIKPSSEDYYESSISQMQKQDPLYEIDPLSLEEDKILTPENILLAFRIIENQIKGQKIHAQYQEILGFIFNMKFESFEKLTEEETQRIKEHLEKLQNTSSWNKIKTFFSYALAIASIIAGITFTATGAIPAGGSLIGSGLANLGKDLVDWKIVSQGLTKDKKKQKELEESIKIVMLFLGGSLGVAGGALAANTSFSTILHYTSLITNLSTSVGGAVIESASLDSESKLITSRSKTSDNKAEMLKISRYLEQALKEEQDQTSAPSEAIRLQIQIMNETAV